MFSTITPSNRQAQGPSYTLRSKVQQVLVTRHARLTVHMRSNVKENKTSTHHQEQLAIDTDVLQRLEHVNLHFSILPSYDPLRIAYLNICDYSVRVMSVRSMFRMIRIISLPWAEGHENTSLETVRSAFSCSSFNR